jgi:hypothetical protein
MATVLKTGKCLQCGKKIHLVQIDKGAYKWMTDPDVMSWKCIANRIFPVRSHCPDMRK